MEYYTKVSVILLFIFGCVCGENSNIENATTNSTTTDLNNESARSSNNNNNMIYAGLMNCAVKYDTACFMDAAENILEVKRNELLAQADREVLKATGRSDPENTPSHLAKTIERLIADLSGLLKDGLSGLFREGDDEVKAVADDNNKGNDNETARNELGESRKLIKKKGPIKKIKSLIKVGLLAVVVFLKVSLLIKLFEAALKFKILLVGLASVVIQGLKFWQEIRSKRNDHHHEENIVYKNPYEGAEFSSPPGLEYHGRSFEGRRGARPVYYDKQYAQEMAYAQSRTA